MSRTLLLASVAALAMTTAACGTDGNTSSVSAGTTNAASEAAGDSPSLAAGDTNTNGTINGNVAFIDLEFDGVEIVAADGDTSGKTGHLHVFVDRDPVAVGESIPKEEGIIHTTDPVIEVSGLSVGSHRLTVVLGDGEHRRIHASAEYVAEFEVAGPTVTVTGPSSVPAGQPVTLDVTVGGVEIVAADGDASGETGHLHVVVDQHPREIAGMGEAFPKSEDVMHTTDTTIEIADLEPGEHTLWVVLGDGNHTLSWDDPVADKVTVVVEG